MAPRELLEVRYLRAQMSLRAAAPMADGEAEAAEPTTCSFSGYACVYDTWYDVCGGPEMGGWREMVAGGAGKRTLNTKPDVRLLGNHGGFPLARTRSGTLTLTEDERGLLVDAPNLDLENPTVAEIYSCMMRGDVDEMSYAFRATRQEWNADYTERIIREYALDVDGSDVSIVTYPASKATVATMRTAARVDELRSGRPAGMSLAMAQAIATQISTKR